MNTSLTFKRSKHLRERNYFMFGQFCPQDAGLDPSSPIVCVIHMPTESKLPQWQTLCFHVCFGTLIILINSHPGLVRSVMCYGHELKNPVISGKQLYSIARERDSWLFKSFWKQEIQTELISMALHTSVLISTFSNWELG